MKRLRLFILLLAIIASTAGNINAGSQSHGTIDFYGHQVSVLYDYNFQKFSLKSLDQQEFNSYVQAFRNHNMVQTRERIKKNAEFYALDDVGLVLFLDKFIEQQFKTQGYNEQTFIKYLLLKEMGYDVLLSRTGRKLNCMGNLSFTPGRYMFISYNNKVYKDLNFDNRESGGKHFIYMDAKKTYKTIERNILQIPKVNAKIISKQIEFHHGANQYQVRASSNASVLEFLEDLPMYSIGHEYTKLSLTQEMNTSLIPYLRKQMLGMSKADGVQFLLSFVQQSTPYGSDYDKYGEERFYYPEETIMATTADCEDKTFLLAYLAKRLLNIKAVALYFEYDEHLSIGLEIPEYDSYSFTYKEKSYVACEPTAKTPRLGFSNFNLKRVTKVIEL